MATSGKRISEADREQIRKHLATKKLSLRAVARLYRIDPKTLKKIANGY